MANGSAKCTDYACVKCLSVCEKGSIFAKSSCLVFIISPQTIMKASSCTITGPKRSSIKSIVSQFMVNLT